MKVKITARKFKARDVLKEYVQAEVESLEHYFGDIMDAEVILSFQHPKDSLKTAEIILKVPGQVLTVSETSEEFEKSVHLGVAKLMRQLEKLKTKRNSR